MFTFNTSERLFLKKQFTVFEGTLSSDAIIAFHFTLEVMSHVNYGNKNITPSIHGLIEYNNSILLYQINHWP